MGKTCEPKAFSFQCMTKFTTNKIKNKKKKEKSKFILILRNTDYKHLLKLLKMYVQVQWISAIIMHVINSLV